MEEYLIEKQRTARASRSACFLEGRFQETAVDRLPHPSAMLVESFRQEAQGTLRRSQKAAANRRLRWPRMERTASSIMAVEASLLSSDNHSVAETSPSFKMSTVRICRMEHLLL